MEAIAITRQQSELQNRAREIANCFLAKGFPYVKVELEANVQPNDYCSESRCFACDGTGRRACSECNGEETILTVCATCSGEGFVSTDGERRLCSDCADGRVRTRCSNCSDGCIECNGMGYFENDDWHESYLDDFWEVFADKLAGTKDLLEHIHAYYDGSVDTEVTLTLWADYLGELPGIVSAFRETCQKFGRCETGNAGLHITLLPDSRYPTKEKLNGRKLDNFSKQVSKLLLGLTCLGSPDDSTRAFEFRDLEISSDRKYSAIYTRGDTCIEYRLFDACFYRPLYIIRYLELIGKTLRYYSDKPKRFLKLKDRISLKKSNEILNKAYRGRYRKLADVFRTDESIARLFKELAYLVERKLRFWLGCVYTLYALGTISKQELFANVVAGLKT